MKGTKTTQSEPPQFKTIEEAGVLVSSLFAEKQKAEASILEMEGLMKEQSNTITEMEIAEKEVAKKVKSQDKTIATHEATIKEMEGLINEQNQTISKLELSKQGGANKLTMTIGKKVFEINSGAKVKGKPFTPAELAEDTEAASWVLAQEGQTILTEIDK